MYSPGVHILIIEYYLFYKYSYKYTNIYLYRILLHLLKIKLANKLIYGYTTINREVVPMKQKFMWILFKMGLSLFTPDYMSKGREIDEHQEREVL